MIQITARMHILVAIEPSMEERGDSWHDPDRKSSVRVHFPGELFVFRSRTMVGSEGWGGEPGCLQS